MRQKQLEAITEEQRKMVENSLPIVGFIVKKHFPKKKFPKFISRDDILAAGYLGLVKAAKDYDEMFGVKFITYASHRIRGEILDELRKQDWLTRRSREMHPDFKVISIEPNVYTSNLEGPERKAIIKDLIEKLGNMINELPLLDREILQLHYLDGVPMKELARRRGLSLSWISRRRKQAREKLREGMEELK